MKGIRQLVLIASVLSTTPVMAEDVSHVFANITFIEPNGTSVGQEVVVSSAPSMFIRGSENGYPAVSCKSSSRTLKAVSLFSGYVVEHKLEGDTVVFAVKKYEVAEPGQAEYSSSDTCNSVMPEQQLIVDKRYSVPIGVDGQIKDLPDGSIMKCRISEETS